MVRLHNDLVEMGMPLDPTFRCEVCREVFPVEKIRNHGILLFCEDCQDDAVEWHDELTERIRNGDTE
jgi:hypothetical protein